MVWRSLFGKTPAGATPAGAVLPSRVSEVQALALSKKPYTKALLLWAADHVDRAEAQYRELFKAAAPRTDALLDRIDSGIVIFSAYCTDLALAQLGHRTVFLPTEPLPREAKAVFAFCGALADQIAGLLQAEGFTTNVDALLRRVIQYKMLLHTEAEIDEQHRLAGKVLAELRVHEAANVRNWHRATERLVEVTLRLQMPEAKEEKQHDLPRLYASQLAALLRTVR